MPVDIYILDLLVIGILLLFVTLGSGWISRLPLSYALIYLFVGILLGPYGFNLIQLRPEAQLIERVTEMVVLISLFSCGLKMNRPLWVQCWDAPIRLLGLVMPISIVAVALIGYFILNLGVGESILLGAILAPTDPVLASEVQLSAPDDRDELRFGLTSEGGLNDALAFPFVYFGLHWIENGGWGNWIFSWVGIDLIWAIAAGIVVGVVVPRAIVWLDRRMSKMRPIDDLMEDFVALSIVLITYAAAEVINGYGFIAVFVAGLVARRSYRRREKSQSQLEFIEQLERLTEVGTILLLGSLLRIEPILRFLTPALIIAGSLLLLIRPIGTWISTATPRYCLDTRLLFGWFGIRGVGSLYYLAYALGAGLKGEAGEAIAWITFITIVISVVVHGITSTPLMNWYNNRRGAEV